VLLNDMFVCAVLSALLLASAHASDRLLSRSLRGDSSGHSYELNEQIPLWANKVGPFSNPRFDP
jgi:hypothetical protein